ncbi:type II toxin-antitoxin system PemK/MazF family toxin [Spongisporangium articulatum]|uniref:mRNA interferase n=1 Tax=Spongisporangium articulatum TaxID=3362603 RepID=A0ABW8AI52_9ACTN
MTESPLRGEVWDVDLGYPVGHEAAFVRPALVVSADRFNSHELVSVCPITRTRKSYPTRVPLHPGVSGLDETSYVQVEHVRTISTARLVGRRGRVTADDLRSTARILRFLFEL